MIKTAQRIYALLTHEYLLYAIVLAISVGTYYARAAVSISTILLGLIGLLTVIQTEKRQALLKNKSIIALTMVFLIVAFSSLYSSNTDMAVTRLFINIPYLALPVGLWAFGTLRTKTIVNLLMIFVGVTALSALAVMVDYIGHFEEYNALYKVGKTIPTPIIHVRYSYFLALGALCSFGMLLDRQIETPRIRAIAIVLGAFLAICTHILAVRTGILALYGGVMTLVVLMIYREGRWKVGLGAIITIAIVSFSSIKLLPSVSNKLGYMMHDLNMLTQKISPEYSDNIRYVSIKHGLSIIRDNPVFGVGVGDIDDAMEDLYEAVTPSVPADRRFPPISQYIFWLASFGIVGTLLLMALLVYPLYKNGKDSYLLWGIYALTAFSFFAETTIQLQLGKTVFLLLVVLVIQSNPTTLNIGKKPISTQ